MSDQFQFCTVFMASIIFQIVMKLQKKNKKKNMLCTTDALRIAYDKIN